ncbi:hypothetical protein GGR53DRAFT_497085 [Hypoxylon sp. FL1150]|nr:hypothetical protein GGR53DRAFT_497085 [Hypoxylon sp. FL1150]
MWKRGGDALRLIKYPAERVVPSWSCMTCIGEISYIRAPFNGVQWKDDLHISFDDEGRLRNETKLRLERTSPIPI